MRETYHGYNEQFMSGKELKQMFSNYFYCIGNHRDIVVLDVTIPEYLESIKIKDEKEYRIFYNETFIKIMSSETDKHIDFIKYRSLSNTIHEDKLLNRDHILCPKCNSDTIFKTGKFGPFWSCKNYPECKGAKHTLILAHDDGIEIKECKIPEDK